MTCDIPAEFYDEQLVTARKPHRCCETGRTIEPGERYWRITGKWDGTVSSYAQSEAAYHFARGLNGWSDYATQRAVPRYPEDCIPFGRVGEWIHGTDDDSPLRDEWDRVKRGEVTRWTTGGPIVRVSA